MLPSLSISAFNSARLVFIPFLQLPASFVGTLLPFKTIYVSKSVTHFTSQSLPIPFPDFTINNFCVYVFEVNSVLSVVTYLSPNKSYPRTFKTVVA